MNLGELHHNCITIAPFKPPGLPTALNPIRKDSKFAQAGRHHRTSQIHFRLVFFYSPIKYYLSSKYTGYLHFNLQKLNIDFVLLLNFIIVKISYTLLNRCRQVTFRTITFLVIISTSLNVFALLSPLYQIQEDLLSARS